ncbi:MAG: methyltransferase [Pedosphaera sp.]|nr:methyltransferase [Pedosphaera sp.]
MNPERVKPIVRWPGGKSRMLKHLLPLIPPHVCYCEPFAGGLAMLLAKPRSPVEVVNDINGDLIALYLNVQKHLPEVLRQIEMVVSSRQLFHLFTQQPGMTDIERGIRFLIRSRTCFGGNMHSFAVAKTTGGGAAFSRQSATALIKAAHERLDKVVIENISYERCFKNYDSADTFFFIDPPYLNCDIDAYQGWDEKRMRQFRRDVGKLKGNWIVTLDDSEFNRDLFQDCKITPVVSANQAVNNRTHKKTLGEIIIQKS